MSEAFRRITDLPGFGDVFELRVSGRVTCMAAPGTRYTARPPLGSYTKQMPSKYH